MRFKNLIFLSLLTTICCAQTVDPQLKEPLPINAHATLNLELRDEILGMWKDYVSQLERLAEFNDSSEREFQAFDALQEKQNVRLKEILSTYGWPGINLVGFKAFATMGSLIQLQDQDSELRKQCLAVLKNAVEQQQKEHYFNYIHIVDQVRRDDDLPQVYGTQWIIQKDGKYVLYPVEDPKNLNQRRAALGLAPMELFIKAFKNIMNFSDSDIEYSL